MIYFSLPSSSRYTRWSAPATLRNQHSVGGDDDQVVDRDDALGGIDLFVGIDVLRELPDPGKVSRLEAANRDVRSPNRLLPGQIDRRERQKQREAQTHGG